MKNTLIIISFLCTAILGYAQSDNRTKVPSHLGKKKLLQKPEFYILEWKSGTILSEESTSLFIEVDSMGLQEVKKLKDTEENVVLYVSNISTPVCADGACKLMHIRLYWTLLGEYAGFDRYTELPLTKHDHDEFLLVDYLKLHELLKDNNSILKRKKINELVDKPNQLSLEGIDAISGATIKDVKESVVAGALYSCYTAWHLVHGKIKEKIKKLTISTIDDNILLTMLQSRHTDYHLFALERLTEKQYKENHERVAEIFSVGIPLVRTFIIKNLPNDFWYSEKLQNPFWKNFSKVDINSRSLLLDHLATAPKSVIEELSLELKVMTKNQLKLFLNHLKESGKVNKTIHTNLISFSNSDTETNAYLVKTFLEDYKP